MHTHTPLEEDFNWPSAITRLRAQFTCGLMSDLVFCKHRKEYGQNDTGYPY